MIARPTSSPLQEVYSFPYYDDIAYIPYTTQANFYEPAFHSDKRLKLQAQFNPYYPQSLDSASNINSTGYGNMQQRQLRTPLSSLNAPHINLQRPSAPASPAATVATTLSQHSTPSPSPSRVTILSSDNSNADWPLYDDSLNHLTQERLSKESRSPQNNHFHYNQSSIPQFNSMMLDSSYPNSGYCPQNQSSMTQFSKPSQQPQRSQHNFLKPTYPKDYQELMQAQALAHHQEMTDDCDEPPALSPSSYKNGHSGRPSISEGDYHSPITPIGSPCSDNGARAPQVRTPAIQIQHPIPKLNRTVSDAVEDELFSHDTGLKDSQQSSKGLDLNNVNPQLARYYQAAQKQHSLAQRTMNSQRPSVRETSPFRANSPFHPQRSQVSPVPPVRHSNLLPGYLTARAQREQQKEMENAALLNQQLQEEIDTGNITPKTISPKDAVLEYPEPEDEASRRSLFAEIPPTNGNGTAPSSYTGSDLGEDEDHDFHNIATSRRGSEAGSMPSADAFSFHSNVPLFPPTFPYLHLPGQVQHAPSEIGASPVGSQASSQHSKPSSPKPGSSQADTGAYTCTDPSCSLRFPTPQKMQKHRREAHRNTTPSGGMTSTLHGARHPGPHKCTRINPTTGKPCNTIFSRPYDLTRHEDTIHNTSREKVRCEICNDEKTFSRQDALTRHKKVKHGIDK